MSRSGRGGIRDDGLERPEIAEPGAGTECEHRPHRRGEHRPGDAQGPPHPLPEHPPRIVEGAVGAHRPHPRVGGRDGDRHRAAERIAEQPERQAAEPPLDGVDHRLEVAPLVDAEGVGGGVAPGGPAPAVDDDMEAGALQRGGDAENVPGPCPIPAADDDPRRQGSGEVPGEEAQPSPVRTSSTSGAGVSAAGSGRSRPTRPMARW